MFVDNFRICEWGDEHREVVKPEDTEPIEAELFCYKNIALAVHKSGIYFRVSEYFTGHSINGSTSNTQIESISCAMDMLDSFPEDYTDKRIKKCIEMHGKYNSDFPALKREIKL